MQGLDISNLQKQLQKRIYRESYYEFFKWAFLLLHPSEKFEDSFHIKYLCDLLQDEQIRIEERREKTEDLIINIPPRTSKSLIVSVAFNAWVWTREPSYKFICISYDEKLSLLNAQLCRDIIQSSEYRELFGDVFVLRQDSNAKSFYFNNHGGYRVSKTTGSNITGFSGLYIILDDPQNPKTVASSLQREKDKSYFAQSLYNRLTPASLGLRCVVMQRLHEDDVTGYLLKSNLSNYRHVCLPAEVAENVSPSELALKYIDGLLDPKRLGRKVLTSLKLTLGTKGFAGQYGQSPGAEEGTMVKKHWFEIVNSTQVVRDLVQNPTHFMIDSAYTSKQENDPTGIMACFERDKRLYILDAIEVWLEFHELSAFIPKYVASMGYSYNSKIFVEPKASGKSLVQNMRASTGLNVIESFSPDKDKITRLNFKTPMIEAKRVVLIQGNYVENYLSQLLTFPNAVHDEFVDLTVMAMTELLEDNAPAIIMI